MQKPCLSTNTGSQLEGIDALVRIIISLTFTVWLSANGNKEVISLGPATSQYKESFFSSETDPTTLDPIGIGLGGPASEYSHPGVLPSTF